MTTKKSTYISIFFFLLGFLVLFYGTSMSYAIDMIERFPKKQIGNEIIVQARNEKKVNIKLSFIGDSLLASFKGEKYKLNFQDLLDSHDYQYPFKYVSNIFMEDDFTIANGENVFTDKNLFPVEKDHNPAYWYYSATRFANIYKESSIEVVSVMNNHSYDYGYEGYMDTIDALKNVGVTYGAEKPVILEKEGKKIGLLCINLFSRFQYDMAISDIKKIRDNVDYLIVFFHGGTEYLFKPTAEIVEYSHGFIDNNVDLVIGAHPHVLEPKEIYKGKTIIYSLGSFLFGGTRTLVNRTIIYQMNLEFNLDKNTLTETDNIIPCYLYSTTNKNEYESWLPSVIVNEEERKKVLDFMNGQIESPI